MEEYRAGYRILVADDDINVHQSLNTYFRREGYQMISAYDGQEAIDHVRKSRPDIVLLDIMMPKMDGLMVCREIRKETNLPIIMLTAKGEEFDKLLGLELGADDYITKPFSPREVLARVKAVLRRMHELKDSGKASHLVYGANRFPCLPPLERWRVCLLSVHARFLGGGARTAGWPCAAPLLRRLPVDTGGTDHRAEQE